MWTLFDHGAVVEYYDAIHFLDGTQAVRYNDCGSLLHELHKCCLDVFFTFTIQCACGLVQYENRCIFEYGSSNDNTLSLPPG